MPSVFLPIQRFANGDDPAVVGKAMIFGVLLLPAIILGALSWWTFEANWIAGAVFVVGLVVAAFGSRRPLKTMALLALLTAELGLLVATAVVGFVIDCARHCS
jgi:hypothetical protein